jgi:hypothetical protein
MSIAELIMQGTEQNTKSTAWVSDSLQKLGQQVGTALKEKEQQRQALEVMPFLQQNMQESMQLAQKGQSGEAYSKMFSVMNPQTLNNPQLLPFIKLGFDAIGKSTDDYQRNRQLGMMETMYGQRYGGEAPGMTEVDPRELARRTLLGDKAADTYSAPQTQVSQATSAQSVQGIPAVNVQRPIGSEPFKEPELPQNGGIADGDVLRDQPDLTQAPYFIPVEKAPVAPAAIDLSPIIKTAKSPAFQEALKSASKNPPSEERKSEYQKFVEQYNKQPEEQKQAVMQEMSLVFPSYKDFENKKANIQNFVPLTKPQTDVVGDNITGLILTPVEEATSTTVSSGESKSGQRQGQSTTFGTNIKALEEFNRSFTGAASELSEGEIGKFLKKNGGVFNVTKNAVPKTQDTDKNPYTKDDMPERVVLYNKNSDFNDPRTEKIELTKPQLVAYQIIKDSPAEMQRLRSRSSESSFVRIAAVGPTKSEAKGLPAIRTGQRPPITDIFGNNK